MGPLYAWNQDSRLEKKVVISAAADLLGKSVESFVKGVDVDRTGNKRSARERNHTMVVGPGLYVLRYVSTRSPTDAPVVRVTPSPTAGAGISLVPPPRAA